MGAAGFVFVFRLFKKTQAFVNLARFRISERALDLKKSVVM